MNTAYYWYRTHPYFGEFYPGKVLNPIFDMSIYRNCFPSLSQITSIKKYFPNGLNPHGLSMLINHPLCDDSFTEAITEIIFELVRQLHFPDSPSRLTSLYASESIEQSEIWQRLWYKNFQNQKEQNAHSLWEISYKTNAKLYDANFLNIMPDDEFSYIFALDSAYQYWQGNISKDPLPELLVPYPVTVVRIVRDYNFSK